MNEQAATIALVTGAAGVTGLAVAKAFAEDGLCVVMADIDEDGLSSAAEEVNGSAYPVVLDVSNPTAVRQAGDWVRGELGDVDILFNNAGILSNNKCAETDDDEWRRLMNINVDGSFFLAREFLPAMKQKGWGRVINMCSLAMKTGGLTAGTAYTTSKGAMAALTFSLARESAAQGVTVNGIAPAYIKTPMVTDQLTEPQRQNLLAEIPVGRFCEAEEIAHVVRFLTSPLAGFITGEIIDINGGLHLD